MMGHSRNGVAALELQRLIGTTYKTAWRMMHQIRALMTEELTPFKGTVEVDETYIGGQSKNVHRAQREERRFSRNALHTAPQLCPCIAASSRYRMRLQRHQHMRANLQP